MEIHFVSSLACEGYGQHIFRSILCCRWHGLDLDETSWEVFWVLDGMGGVWSTHVEMHFFLHTSLDTFYINVAYEGFGQHMFRCIWFIPWHRMGFINTSWDTICVLWSTKFRYILCLAWNGFIQHRLRYIFCPRWHGMDLFYTCWDAFCYLASIEGILSTHDEMHLLPSLPLDELGQYTLRYIFCPRWHWMFWSTNWDASFVLPGIGWVSLT